MSILKATKSVKVMDLSDKKERVKGLDRLMHKALAGEKILLGVQNKLEAWGVPDVGSTVLSVHLAQLKAAGFKAPRVVTQKADFIEGQTITLKPNALLSVLEAYYGEDATGEEFDGLQVVKVTRKGSEKNSPRQIVCKAADGTRIVVSPSQVEA